MLFLGIDVGSSSVKLCVYDGASGRTIAACQHPATELVIDSPAAGFAEQHPDTWWSCVVAGLAELAGTVELKAIAGIGISYQMHGLVLVDEQLQVLRPSIIWCDSRAIAYGSDALKALGSDLCYERLLNSPGNFTGAKLRWVQMHEPETFQRVKHVLLPGDYIALRLSGSANTTACGLSEGTLWDFKAGDVAEFLLDHWHIPRHLVAPLVPSFAPQAEVARDVAHALGLTPGTPITYRAGDQPNNAFSLNVLEPGEVAATAGTSGVIYAVTDQPATDSAGRVNTFMHVTDQVHSPRNGVLACVNGTGRANSWLRQMLAQAGSTLDYSALNQLAAGTAIGAEGLTVLPFGNGAERLLKNRNPGAQTTHLDFNRHGLAHWVRATQEGIAFALNYGFDVLQEIGVKCSKIRAGNSNMFLSPLFAEAFANASGAEIELYNTDGAQGAARAAALGARFYRDATEAFTELQVVKTITPKPHLQEAYGRAYERWQASLAAHLQATEQ